MRKGGRWGLRNCIRSTEEIRWGRVDWMRFKKKKRMSYSCRFRRRNWEMQRDESSITRARLCMTQDSIMILITILIIRRMTILTTIWIMQNSDTLNLNKLEWKSCRTLEKCQKSRKVKFLVWCKKLNKNWIKLTNARSKWTQMQLIKYKN